MNKKIIHTPDNFRDWLPEECAAKDWIFGRVGAIFEQYNYQRVESPGLEFLEVFDSAVTFKNESEVFTLTDNMGNILALRADMTPPMARIASTAYKEADAPCRFYYHGNIFTKTSNLQGKLSESPQAGIELFGVDSPEADAEAIEVAIRALMAAGVEKFVLNIGHVGFVQGILNHCGLSDGETERIMDMLDQMDYVGISQLVEQAALDSSAKEILTQLPLLVGGKEMLLRYQQLADNEQSKAAIERLLMVYELLDIAGVCENVSFDLGLVNHLDYYTGMMFRAYAHGSGFPVASGGRYDTLTHRFGMDTPSVGATIKVNNLIDICARQMRMVETPVVRALVAYEPQGRRMAMQTAAALREKAIVVENTFLIGDEAGNLAYAKNQGLDYLLFFGDAAQPRLTCVADGKSQILAPSEILSALGGEA